jgi:hypothetical protein
MYTISHINNFWAQESVSMSVSRSMSVFMFRLICVCHGHGHGHAVVVHVHVHRYSYYSKKGEHSTLLPVYYISRTSTATTIQIICFLSVFYIIHTVDILRDTVFL